MKTLLSKTVIFDGENVGSLKEFIRVNRIEKDVDHVSKSFIIDLINGNFDPSYLCLQ